MQLPLKHISTVLN